MEVEVVGVTEEEVATVAGMEVVVGTVVAGTDHDVPDPDQDLDRPTTEIDIKETNTQHSRLVEEAAVTLRLSLCWLVYDCEGDGMCVYQ